MISTIRVLSLAMVGAISGGFAQNTQPPFSIQISTPQPVVETAAQAKITVLLTNISDRIAGIYLENNGNSLFSGFQAHIYDRDHKHLKMTNAAWMLSHKKTSPEDKNDYSGYKKMGWIRSGGWGPLNPQESADTYFVLSEAYTLGPGTYTLYMTREDPDSKTIATSNTLTITITGAVATATPTPLPATNGAAR